MDALVGQQLLIKKFRKGARFLCPAAAKPPFPSLDLPVVLEVHTGLSFEPTECADLRVLSLKAVLLLALTSACLCMHPGCSFSR